MRIIVHIGCEKTGSTALQEFLYANRRVLQEYGIALLDAAGVPNNRDLVAAFEGETLPQDYLARVGVRSPAERDRHIQTVLRRISSEMEGLKSTADTMVLTSEHFQSRLRTDQQVSNFSKFISIYADSYHIACYIRNQADQIESLYSTALKVGKNISPDMFFEKYLNERYLFIDISSMLRRWLSVFGRSAITVRVFSKTVLYQGDIRHDFMTHFLPEVPLEAMVFENRRSNESLTTPAMHALRIVNRMLPEIHRNGRYNKTAAEVRRLVVLAFGRFGSKARVMSPEFRARIADKCRVSNRDLSREFLDDAPFP